MKVRKNIDFSSLNEAQIFKQGSKEYKQLDSLNDDGEWKDYCNKMLSKGVSVVYDATGDYFVAKPVNENKMNKNFKKSLLEDDKKFLLFDEEDVDEDNDTDVEVLPGKDLDIEAPIDQLTNIEGDIDNIEAEMNDTVTDQLDTNPVGNVDSSLFNINDLNKIVDQLVSQRLGTTANASTEQKTPANDPLASSQDIVDQNAGVEEFITSTSEFSEVQSQVAVVKDKVENESSYLEELNGEAKNTGSLTPGGVSTEPVEISETSELDTAVQSSIGNENEFVCNGTVDFNGQPVKIQITGFVLTDGEVQELAEAAKKNKCKLVKIESKNEDVLSLIVESNKKHFRINYKDNPYAVSSTPWSIKDFKFGTLKEAFTAINQNKKKVSNQARFFNKLVLENKDLSKRQITNFRESEAFTKSEFPTWATKSVGIVNLKNGLNEVFSNITKHNPIVKNTLVKTKNGEHILLKGCLTEGKVGAKRQLVDTRKDYGVVTVVGIYENSQRGLGQIMETIQRVAIPLMVWI